MIICRLQEEEAALRNQLLQSESRKRNMESELDAMRRRFEQSEGGKDALMTQIGKFLNFRVWFTSNIISP